MSILNVKDAGMRMVSIRFVGADACRRPLQMFFKAIPHNSKCRYGERGAAAAKPKAQIILDPAKVSAASGGNSEPKQGQRSQSARGFCPRSTMRVPQPDVIEHFGNADAVPQPPERCLSRKAGIVRCCLRCFSLPNSVGAHILCARCLAANDVARPVRGTMQASSPTNIGSVYSNRQGLSPAR